MSSSNNSLISGNKLKQAVDILYDMEMHLYLMEQSYQLLTNKINALGHKRNITAPKRQVGYESGAGLLSAIIGAILGAVGGAIWLLFDSYIGQDLTFLLILITPLAFIICCGAGAICGGIVGIIIGFIIDYILKAKKQKIFDKEYEIELAEYNKKVANDNARVRSELQQQYVLKCERNALAERYQESKDTLQWLYDAIGIDAKFQGIGTVAIMHEFIRLGISNKLDGTDGLYYLILQEYKYINISGKLDHICEKLDEISMGISSMHDSMDEMNRKSQHLISETVKISKIAQQASNNSAITAYNTERINKELEYRDIVYLMSL